MKQDYARDKQFESTVHSYHGSSPTDIRMWYQYFTIHSSTHGIYIHLYYCFIPEANDFKGLSSGNATNTNKHDLPAKHSTILSEWGDKIYTAIGNKKSPPRIFILRMSSSRTTTHMDTKLSIP